MTKFLAIFLLCILSLHLGTALECFVCEYCAPDSNVIRTCEGENAACGTWVYQHTLSGIRLANKGCVSSNHCNSVPPSVPELNATLVQCSTCTKDYCNDYSEGIVSGAAEKGFSGALLLVSILSVVLFVRL